MQKLRLLTLPLFVLVLLPMSALIGFPLWPAMLATAVAAVVCVALAVIPRVVVTDDAVILRGVFSSTTVTISDVTGVEMARGRVRFKDAWILCVLTEHSNYVFNWVAFFRTDMATPWTGEAPPPRAERARAQIESAIDGVLSSQST